MHSWFWLNVSGVSRYFNSKIKPSSRVLLVHWPEESLAWSVSRAAREPGRHRSQRALVPVLDRPGNVSDTATREAMRKRQLIKDTSREHRVRAATAIKVFYNNDNLDECLRRKSKAYHNQCKQSRENRCMQFNHRTGILQNYSQRNKYDLIYFFKKRKSSISVPDFVDTEVLFKIKY